jgi:hypothetical protein
MATVTRQPKPVTAYIGELSTWTWSFSTSRNVPMHVRDVDNVSHPATMTCVRAGVETRAVADSPPALSPTLAQDVDELDSGTSTSHPARASTLS